MICWKLVSYVTSLFLLWNLTCTCLYLDSSGVPSPWQHFFRKEEACKLNLKLHYSIKMFGGNNSNHALPMFLDENRFQLNTNAPNHQLQLFGNCKFWNIISSPYSCNYLVVFNSFTFTLSYFFMFSLLFSCELNIVKEWYSWLFLGI